MADFCPCSLLRQEDEHLRLEAQRSGLELPGLQSHEVPWSQERALLTQEVRLFRRNTIIFYMKLRSILMHWRLGRKDNPPEETGHPEVSAGGLEAVDHFVGLSSLFRPGFPGPVRLQTGKAGVLGREVWTMETHLLYLTFALSKGGGHSRNRKLTSAGSRPIGEPNGALTAVSSLPV